jgi:hypothetical protein
MEAKHVLAHLKKKPQARVTLKCVAFLFGKRSEQNVINPFLKN